MHTNTHKLAKKTQTDKQTEHTHADNMRNKPSNSTNTKKSTETDRYDTAATTNTKRDITHSPVHSEVFSKV